MSQILGTIILWALLAALIAPLLGRWLAKIRQAQSIAFHPPSNGGTAADVADEYYGVGSHFIDRAKEGASSPDRKFRNDLTQAAPTAEVGKNQQSRTGLHASEVSVELLSCGTNPMPGAAK